MGGPFLEGIAHGEKRNGETVFAGASICHLASRPHKTPTTAPAEAGHESGPRQGCPQILGGTKGKHEVSFTYAIKIAVDSAVLAC